MSLSGTLSFGAETSKPSCKDVIAAADKAIKEQKDEIAAQDEAIQKCDEANKALHEQADAKDRQLHNPLRQPIVLLGAGIIGVVTVGPAIAGLGAIVLSVLLK